MECGLVPAIRGECGGGSNNEDGGIVVEGKKRR